MEKIDFVILWVDDQDKKWQKDKDTYSKKEINDSNSKNRFRDWDNLKYWFRGVEKYANWVNKIYFITYGHLPKWLNTKSEKLQIINHSDYIEKKFLPTFNSNVIEINLNKIDDLSEHFVVFNDDMFIVNKTTPTDFFKHGLPCDEAVQNIITSYGKKEQIAHALINNIDIINRNFKKRSVMKKALFKHINLKYGVKTLRTIFLLPWYAFTGFHNPHLPISHLKSTFNTVWEKEYVQLDNTCKNRFRENNDITHWVFRYWNICENKFIPRNHKIGKYFDVSNNNQKICSTIKGKKCKLICINDSSTDFDFEQAKREINASFETKFPEKSSFEK